MTLAPTGVDLECRDANRKDCYGYSQNLKVQNTGVANTKDSDSRTGEDSTWPWSKIEKIKITLIEWYYE